MFCNKVYLLASVALYAGLFQITEGASWNYQDFDQWSTINAVCGSGTQQSPIDVDRDDVEVDANLAADPLLFINYESVFDGDLVNNGHTSKSSPVYHIPD